jgi:hypothetical protein
MSSSHRLLIIHSPQIEVQSQPKNSSRDPIWKKAHHKKGLVEWLKV